MAVELILIALTPVFIVFVIYEYIKHKDWYVIKDSVANTVLALLHQVSDGIALLLLMPFFYVLYDYRLFDISLNVYTIAFAFIIQDFLYYWFHRASHNIHWLWAAHVVHHSSTKMNFSTAFRQSLMYPIAGMWLFWLPMILIGFDPKTVFAVVALNLAYQFFVHTQINYSGGQLGKWWRLWFNTPSYHRVHHSINKPYIDKNFAGVLIIWDKCFGTFVEEQAGEPCRYGIKGQIDSNNPFYITFHQWRYMGREFLKNKGIKDKCKVLFGYPTHEDHSVKKCSN